MASNRDIDMGAARTILERGTPDDGPVTTARITSSRELEMPPIMSYTASSPCHEEQHNGVAGTSSETLHPLTPSAFSDAIDAIGMGPFQTRLIFMCGMGFIIDAIEIMVISFLLDDIGTTFGLSDVGQGIIGSASFLGMLLGAGFWSVYADKRGRRSAFVVTLAFVFVGGVVSAVSPSLVWLCVCRVAVGFGIGGNLPVTTALLTEFLPTSHRAYVLCRLAGTFWGVGMIASSLLGLILTNVYGTGQEEMFWRWFLGLAAMPSAIVAVAYKLLPESPRYLGVMKKHDEAMQVLEYVARTNGKLDVLGLDFASHRAGGNSRITMTPSDDDSALMHQGKVTKSAGENSAFVVTRNGEGADAPDGEARGAENAMAGDVRELFHSPILRRITLCIWTVWLFLNLSYYGITFLLPKYFSQITGGKRNDEYILFALVGFSYIPGAWVAMWLSSEYCLGRVGTMKWLSFVTAACILLMATATHASVLFIVLSLLSLFCIAIPGTIMYLITPELYSTKYRTVGLGSASVVTRIGGILAPILAEVLHQRGGDVAPLVVFGPMMIITGVAAALIPVETAGRKLDDDSWDRRTPVVEPMEDAFVVNTGQL